MPGSRRQASHIAADAAHHTSSGAHDASLLLHRERQFTYIATPAVAARPGHNLAAWIFPALILLALAIALIWHYSFRPADMMTSLDDVQREYLAALKSLDLGTMQQLASDDSKGTLLPPWLVVVESHQVGDAQVTGNHAEVPLEVRLAPSPSAGETLSITQKAAISRTYRVPIALRRSSAGWRIDQQGLLEQMQHVLQRDNPNVQFPPWE